MAKEVSELELDLSMDLIANSLKLKGDNYEITYKGVARLLRFDDQVNTTMLGGVCLKKEGSKRISQDDINSNPDYYRDWNIIPIKNSRSREGRMPEWEIKSNSFWDLSRTSECYKDIFNLVFLKQGKLLISNDEGSYRNFLKKQGELQGIILEEELLSKVFDPIDQRILHLYERARNPK